jgi:hypothetical protein
LGNKECPASKPDQDKGIHTFKAGLGKSTCQDGKEAEKKWRIHINNSFFFILLLISFFLHLLTFERYPRSFAFVALDRMVGLGLGAFL